MAAAAQFFLFSDTQEALERRVDEALVGADSSLGLKDFASVLDRFSPSEPLWRGGVRNPLFTYAENGDDLDAASAAAVAFGVPLEGPADEVKALFAAIRGCDDTGDPLRRCVIGGEFGPARSPFATLAWRNWTTGTGRGDAFGARRQARRLIGADALEAAGLDGRNVQVVVVDQGLNQRYVEEVLGGRWGLGFAWDTGDGLKVGGQVDAPYQSMPREHGSMVVRTVHDLAPKANFWDLPLLPRQVTRVTPFALSATFAMYTLRLVRTLLAKNDAWVIVNAWGMDDRLDEDVYNDFATQPLHPLNVQTRALGQIADVIFAAGNSGQFRPDPEAGAYDRGPGRSIWGANAGGHVTSVGAVRADACWVGTSSQGPGPASLGIDPAAVNEKPDLCAPSWFRDDHDRALRSGGTSAACAVVAGVVAALRTGWPQSSVSPAALRGYLRATARRDWHVGWNGRMGDGVVNAPSVLTALNGLAPNAVIAN